MAMADEGEGGVNSKAASSFVIGELKLWLEVSQRKEQGRVSVSKWIFASSFLFSLGDKNDPVTHRGAATNKKKKGKGAQSNLLLLLCCVCV